MTIPSKYLSRGRPPLRWWSSSLYELKYFQEELPKDTEIDLVTKHFLLQEVFYELSDVFGVTHVYRSPLVVPTTENSCMHTTRYRELLHIYGHRRLENFTRSIRQGKNRSFCACRVLHSHSIFIGQETVFWSRLEGEWHRLYICNILRSAINRMYAWEVRRKHEIYVWWITPVLVPPKNCLEPIISLRTNKRVNFRMSTQKLIKLLYSNKVCMETLFLYSYSSVHLRVGKWGSVHCQHNVSHCILGTQVKCRSRF